MGLAQKITTMVLSLRKKTNLRVRQPLQKIIIPLNEKKKIDQILAVKDILLAELNIKEIEFIDPNSEILIKKIKPNFKILGPRFGDSMNLIVSRINN